jgi:uncharacterized membrane protein YkoI
MKKSLIIGLFLATLSTCAFAADDTATTSATTDSTTATTTSAKTVAANASAKKSISVSNLLLQLQKAGYVVKEVDYDKDNLKFKVDAVDRHGDKQSLDLDATVGLPADQRKVSHELAISQAAKKVEKDGAYIKSIQFDSGNYKVTVVDKQGNEQSATIDGKTGAVTKS